MLKVKILKMEGGILPHYEKDGDAGMDLYAMEDVIIKSGERAAVRTGIKMEIPEGYVGLVWDKSGLAAKSGVKTMAGVIDSGYRGELKIVLINLSKEDFAIKKHSKIAQLLIQKIERPEIEEVSELSETERGDNGFGSTGLHANN